LSRKTSILLIALSGALGVQVSHAQADDKLAKKVEKLDAQFIKKCSELAIKYDEDKNPEAAHFFASCALGYGSKDDKLIGIRNTWEISVFIGKVRGGKELVDTDAITSVMRGLTQEYKGIRDALWTDGTRGNLGEPGKKILRDAGVKMELTQNAHEYIRATERFNALRQAMGLRGLFWDFENSTRLILVAWYMGQTGDYNDNLAFSRAGVNKGHVLYTPAVEDAKKQVSIVNGVELKNYPEHLRPFPLLRQDLLNPNARTLWLAQWVKGYALPSSVLYAIPQLPYRDDIPTPSARFGDETVVKPWSGWIDTEDTILLDGRKVPYVRYPYDGEPNAPFQCYGGEDGWEKSEYKFLSKAGVPIMWRCFTKSPPTDVEVGLVDGDNKSISGRTYMTGDKRATYMHSWATILFLPEQQLAQGQKYHVTIKCKIGPTAIEKSWGFTTRKE
jgi:hypothetical protein